MITQRWGLWADSSTLGDLGKKEKKGFLEIYI